MTEEVDPSAPPPERERWWSRWGITVLGLVVLVLTGVTAVLSIDQGTQTRRIAAEGKQVAHTVNQIQTEALCPLLGLFLKSYHPERQPPDQLEFYEHAFQDIRRMNAVLACHPT